jgi:hypothetical protein
VAAGTAGPAQIAGPGLRGAQRAETYALSLVNTNGDNNGMPDDLVSKEELQSAIETRKELDEEMEPVIVDAFVARIEQRLAERDERSERALQLTRNHQKEMVLGSMAIGIPMLALAAVFTGLAGIIVVCIALVVIAVVSTRG